MTAAESREWRYSQARRFLNRLDPEAERFTFQTFDDTGAERGECVRILHGDFDSEAAELDALQVKRAGVFVTINETDFKGRSIPNVKRVRAVFADFDGEPWTPALEALEPHIACESSPGRFHAYWLVDDCPLDQFSRVQGAISRRFKSDPKVKDLPRVMRLPGFQHFKGEAQTSKIIDGVGNTGPAYTLATIIERLGLQLDAPAAERRGSDDATSRTIGDGERNTALTREAGKLRRLKYSATEIAAALKQINHERCRTNPLSAAEVDKIAHSVGRYETPGDGPAPVDLLKAMTAPPLRVADVPDVLGRFAEAHAEATGFDVSIMLMGGVVAAAAMLSDEVRLCVSSRSSWFESARLWGVVIGGSSSGKSPGLKAVQAPMFAVHRELMASWQEQYGDQEKPAEGPPCIYTSDSTTEALADILRERPRGVLYTVDELHSWLESHDAYRNGGGKDRGEWLRLYDGGPHQVNRVKRGAFLVENWGASLLSATTPVALRELAPKLPADGLLQRILPVVVRHKLLPGSTVQRADTAAQTEEWTRALRGLYIVQPQTVYFSNEARTVFEAEQVQLHELTIAFEEVQPSYAAHVGKRVAMLARLALVFHALEANAISEEVTGATMRRAVRFLRQQERHSMAMYTTLLGGDSGMALAQAIARSILASELQAFNRRELSHKCKAFRSAEEWKRGAALTLLCDYGWLTSTAGSVTHGAQWDVDPRVHELFAEHGELARERRETVRSRIREFNEELATDNEAAH